MVWFPFVLVQLFTTWNCCSLSTSGQLQRPIFRPSPKGDSVPLPTPAVPPFRVNWKPANPPVTGGPTTPGPVLSPGKPKVAFGAQAASEYGVRGLYLK